MMVLEQFKPAARSIVQPLDTGWAEGGFLAEAALQGALVDGTMIATDDGWRPVESLRRGDRVLTFQNGFRSLRTVERQSLWSAGGLPEGLRPLRFAPNVLGNVTAMTLMPGQIVLRDADDRGKAIAPELVEAASLCAAGDVVPVQPGRELSVTRLCFAEPQLVCANYGAVVLCARAGDAGRPMTADSLRAQPALGTISEELLSSLFGNLDLGARQEEAA